MTSYKGANITKWDAGGSGDNVISDGYIKSVEKVWIDSYTFAAVLTTADTIDIAKVPANKKITSIEVFFPDITPTTCTILVGNSGDTDFYIDENVVAEEGAAGGQAAVNVARMTKDTGFSYVTTAETTIQLAIGVTAMTAPTAGTIKTIVRYT